MTPTGVIFIILALISVAVFVDEELRIARRPREVREALEEGELWPGEHAQDRLFDSLLEAVEVPPDHEIVVWTPQERELLGHNETLRFISETDKILGAFEWQKIKADANQRVISGGEWTTTSKSAEVIAGTITTEGILMGSQGITVTGKRVFG